MKPRNNRVPLFLGASTAILIVVLAVPSRQKPAENAPAAALESSSPHAPPSVSGVRSGANNGPTAEQLASLRARSAALTWGRDPFRSPSSSTLPVPVGFAPEPGQPRLTGISQLQNRSMAIVDRQVVRAGDQLASGHVVVEIAENAVVLSLDGKKLTLTLGTHP